MAMVWNPQALLDVYPDSCDYTCVGTTRAGARCLLRVNRPDRTKAARMLDDIAYQRPTSTIVKKDLEEIAELSLCLRWHRARQVDDVLMKWERIITQSFPRRHRENTSSSATVPLARTASFRQTRSSAPSPSPATTLRPTPEVRVSTIRPSVPRSTREIVQSNPRVTTSRYHLRSSATTSVPVTVPSSRTSPAVAHTHRAHDVRRRPITEDCGICYEAIHSLDDAVWCRAQCGQNIHRECWDLWRGSRPANTGNLDADEEQLKCVFCRAPWVENEIISSSSSSDTHRTNRVTRRSISEDCVICLDEIQSLGDAVWCRGQCGQNIHSRCWDRWSEEYRSNRRNTSMEVDVQLTCVFCRAPWVQ